MFTRHTKFVLGVGTQTKFWRDIWSGEEALKDFFSFVFLVVCNQEALVADLMVRLGETSPMEHHLQ